MTIENLKPTKSVRRVAALAALLLWLALATTAHGQLRDDAPRAVRPSMSTVTPVSPADVALGSTPSQPPCHEDGWSFYPEYLHEQFLDWTPDGSRIIFSYGTTIQSIDSEGSLPQTVIDVYDAYLRRSYEYPLVLRFHFHADVSPLSSRIVYTTCRLPSALPPRPPSTFWYDPMSFEWYDPLFVPYHFDLAAMNLDGSEKLRLTDNPLFDHYPVWSPDETRIAFISRHMEPTPDRTGGRLYTMAPDGSDVRLITPTMDSVAFYPPAWSPDGQRIAFTTVSNRLYTVGADGSGLTRVAENLSVLSPTWSSDGSELAFAMSGEDEAGIYAVRSDGRRLRLIAPGEASLVSWSPDGTEILFITDTVSLVRPDGGGLRSLGDANTIVDAAWSPDGSRIALFSFTHETAYDDWVYGGAYSDTSGSISTVARDGTDRRLLVSWEPHWGAYYRPGPLVAANPEDRVSAAETCGAGIVVPQPESNPGLVGDCEILLRFNDMVSDTAYLNWGVRVPITNWEGVVVSGSPPRVRELRLRYHELSSAILPEFGGLRALERLYLGETDLRGAIPPELGRLTALEELDLPSNSLDSYIPPELADLANLKRLNLSDNRLVGSIPHEFGGLAWWEGTGLARLQELDLSRNNLTGYIPRELENIETLVVLRLGGNDLSGSLDRLRALTNLRVLDVSGNHFRGPFPRRWMDMKELTSLDMSGNSLYGEIPSYLGNWTNLKVLNLRGNFLEGAIVPELGNLTNLEGLNLSRNRLTGNIPPELGNLTNLEMLNLSRNRLTGNIPPELGDLENHLYCLNLGDNNLEEGIPEGLGRLDNRGDLYFVSRDADLYTPGTCR